MELTTSIEIERPIADVFAYWADLENGSEWASAVIERTKITDGPVGVGTRYRAVEQFPGRKVQFTVEITEFELNRRMAAIWEDLPVEAGWVATFEESNGGTRLTMIAQINPSGGLMKALIPLMSRWVKRANQKDLETLKARLESRAA